MQNHEITKVEYRIRPTTRFVVTRYYEGGRMAGCETRGEYDNADVAYQVAYALCKAEHDAAGANVGDMGFIYPQHPGPTEIA